MDPERDIGLCVVTIGASGYPASAVSSTWSNHKSNDQSSVWGYTAVYIREEGSIRLVKQVVSLSSHGVGEVSDLVGRHASACASTPLSYEGLDFLGVGSRCKKQSTKLLVTTMLMVHVPV